MELKRTVEREMSNHLETKDTKQFKIRGPNISKSIMVTCQIFPNRACISVFCL